MGLRHLPVVRDSGIVSAILAKAINLIQHVNQPYMIIMYSYNTMHNNYTLMSKERIKLEHVASVHYMQKQKHRLVCEGSSVATVQSSSAENFVCHLIGQLLTLLDKTSLFLGLVGVSLVSFLWSKVACSLL